MNKQTDFVNEFKDANSMVPSQSKLSLKKVSEEIQQSMDMVEAYRKKVESLSVPLINNQPWWKFNFGKASVDDVNDVLKSFSDYVQETFKLLVVSQRMQNENDMNICRLLGMLAMAEAESYEKLKQISADIVELSNEDEESANKLKELETSFLQSLNDSAIDGSKKEEQMSRLIDYITLFAESKNKKIRSISLSLSKINSRLEKYCSTQDNWIEQSRELISLWQKEINEQLSQTQNQIEETILTITKSQTVQLDEHFETLKCSLVQSSEEQRASIALASEHQAKKVDLALQKMDNVILDYKLLVDNQTQIIEGQSRLINQQNENIQSLKRKVWLSLTISFIAIASAVGTIILSLCR